MDQYGEENEMFGQEQPQNPGEEVNPHEELTPEELWQTQQQPYMIPQQNYANQMIAALTSLMAMFVPMAMMGSMAGGVFAQRSWIPPAERARLEEIYPFWAVQRAEQMVPPVAGIPAVEAAAKHMWERYQATIGITAPGAPVTRKAKTPSPKAPTPRAAGLTAEEVESLVADIKEYYSVSEGRFPDIDTIKEWGKDKFNKAIATPAARTVLDKAKREV